MKKQYISPAIKTTQLLHTCGILAGSTRTEQQQKVRNMLSRESNSIFDDADDDDVWSSLK